MSQEPAYNAQCISCGAAWEIPHGSALEERAIEREKTGKLDAICVSGEECGCESPTARDLEYADYGYG